MDICMNTKFLNELYIAKAKFLALCQYNNISSNLDSRGIFQFFSFIFSRFQKRLITITHKPIKIYDSLALVMNACFIVQSN